jgi:acetylornithine deacetylase/succinyl-diaminopimelate desuccinylase-like protein
VKEEGHGSTRRPRFAVGKSGGGLHGPHILDPVPERELLERRATELLQRLIRFDTVNPPGNEQAAQEFLQELLDDAGFECELLAAVEGRPNLVARMSARSDGPRLCLLGHVDTVLADPREWSVDPWAGELRDGCVWGRGAVDMKGQVAAEATAALALAGEGWRPEAGELVLVFTCDEESGAVHGARWLCEQRPESVRCDLVVNEGAGAVFEFGGRRLYGVCVAEKGVFRFTLATDGRAGHASIPGFADNALVKMAPLLEALADGRREYVPTPESAALLQALRLDSGDLEAALRAIAAEDPRLALFVEPMLGVSLAPTMITGSEKINVIPSHSELQVDCRVPPELGEDAVLAAVRARLGEDGYEVRFDERIRGNRSSVQTPLMDAIGSFVRREDPDAEVAPVVLAGFSDSHWWRRAFPDCVAYGFFPQRAMDAVESLSLFHAADERVPVEDLGLAASFYADLAEETLR